MSEGGMFLKTINGKKKEQIGKNVKIGAGTTVEGEKVVIEDNVNIGEQTSIIADDIYIGYGSFIGNRCQIEPAGEETKFIMGDHARIGGDSTILVPVFQVGDYTTMHNHALVNGMSPCLIGHNTYIGQNCILNANEALRIGNNVGVGTYSSIWTHGFYGELIEGCNIFKVAPVTIEDNAWILGSYNVIFPGVTLGRKSVIMTGSVVTQDVEPEACVSGNPAADISDKLPAYREVSIDEKYRMMEQYIDEFIKERRPKDSVKTDSGWQVKVDNALWTIVFLPETTEDLLHEDEKRLVFTKKKVTKTNLPNTVIFELESKKYTKKRTPLEIEVIKFLLPYRARFVPMEE
jgi:acetyltransferase-like isoleucine patch superfamily enzyme